MKNRLYLLWPLFLLLAPGACNFFTSHHLVSEEYGFSVDFPGKPVEQPGKNYQGLAKSLWTLEDDSHKEFFSAEATTYKEPLNPGPNWIPDSELLVSVGIQTTESRRFTLLAPSTGREVLAIATTGRQAISGATLSSIYIVDGRTFISVTARTENAGRRSAFLSSLTLLR